MMENEKKLVFDFTFKKIDWELTEENIEKYREEIDNFGVVYINGEDGGGDFIVKVLADGDIADMLYDALEELEEIREEYPEYAIYYTIKCDVYGGGKVYEYGQEMGQILSEALGDESNYYSYSANVPAVCRIKWEGVDFRPHLITTNENGYYDGDLPEVEFENILKNENEA